MSVWFNKLLIMSNTAWLPVSIFSCNPHTYTSSLLLTYSLYMIILATNLHTHDACLQSREQYSYSVLNISNLISHSYTYSYYTPLSHLHVSPSAIHITDDPLLNTSHTYDGSPVPLKPSSHCSSHID